ncbi:MAG TPA: PQQ-binding-like beta-propeller repeat protein [Chloroflexota bacterium]|nr:PQQ-binding-like beta-propeller repeat protein [Chloroflexota bacterium]
MRSKPSCRVRSSALRLTTLVLSLLLPLLAPARPLAADGPQAGAPWPQFKQNGTRNGRAPRDGPAFPVKAWAFDAKARILSGPVIGADGTIYVITAGGKLKAINPNGTERWTYTFQGGFPTYPLVNGRGQVVFGLDSGYVLGIDPRTGNEAWRFDIRGAPYGPPADDPLVTPIASHPAAAANYGRVLVGTDHGVLYELETGAPDRVRRASGSIKAGAAITPDGTIVWATDARKVYGGLAEGGDKWQRDVDGAVLATPAVAPDSTTYVATQTGSVYAFKSDGAQKWRVSLGFNAPIFASPTIGPDDTVYVGSSDGRLYALDPATGATKWSYGTFAAIIASSIVGPNGSIYVGSTDSLLYVLSRDGQLQSAFKADGPITFSSPALGADGTLYVGSDDGKLYALVEGAPGAAVAPPAPGLATPAPAVTTPRPTVVPAPAAPAPQPPSPTEPVPPLADARYFHETGHNVRGAFLKYFLERGGLEQFGYPRTEELVQDGRTVQYFQRARFEHYPELAGTPHDVQLSLIGYVAAAERLPFPTATPVESSEDVLYVPDVQHTLRGPFLRYFLTNGGGERFGYPISEEMEEPNRDGSGRTYTVQYFQRARLEYHPELAGTPAEVQVGLIIDELFIALGLLKG